MLKRLALTLLLIAPSLAGAESYDIKYTLLATFGKNKNQHSLDIKTFSTPKECKDAKNFISKHLTDHKNYSELLLSSELETLKIDGCYKKFQKAASETNIVKKFTLQELLNVNFDSDDELKALAILDREKFMEGKSVVTTSAGCASKIYYSVRERKNSLKEINKLEEKGIKDRSFSFDFSPEGLSYTCIPIIE